MTMEAITKEKVDALAKSSHRYICFDLHKGQRPKRYKDSDKGSYVGAINLPFGSGIIKHFFPYELYKNNNSIYCNNHAVWRSIQNENEFQEIEAFCEKWKRHVFLRDLLFASLALDFYRYQDNKVWGFTDIGCLERKSKQDQDENSIRTLAQHSMKTIRDINIYNEADFICAVPHDENKGFDLPCEIVARISGEINKPDITSGFVFENSKEPLRDLSVEEKWEEWEQTGLKYTMNHEIDIRDKNVILLDDKYQSGITIHFIASKLQEVGIKNIYGLCLVKTPSNTDNQWSGE